MNFSKRFLPLLVAFTVLFAVGCSSTSTQESTGEYIDDTVITTKVKAAIFNDPELSSAEINVETFKGAVQLSGFVATSAETRKATTLARAVSGVQSVRNDIVVK